MERIGLAPGSEVGGYRIIAPLGSGGMGTVYRALDGAGTAVALKLLHPHIGADPVARDRLRREVAALQRLRHRGVAAVLDAEADSTEAFVVTELVHGRNLEEEVQATGALPAAELARLAAGLLDALEAVHAAGVVHRDLKPTNVLITAAGPVLIDFGIAQAAGDPRLTSTDLVVGTPGYLAPEQFANAEPSAVTDWWGWAAVLAFAATGRAPFGTRPVQAVLARSRAGDVDVEGLDPLTAGALRAALDPDPDRRALPEELVADLTEAAATGQSPVSTQPVSTQPPSTQLLPVSVPPTAVLQVPVDDAGPAGPPGRDEDFDEVSGDEFSAPVEPDAPAGYAPAGYAPAGYARTQPRRRAGSVLALALLGVAGSALYPGLTLVLVAVALVLVRTVGSVVEAVQTRRERRGGLGRAEGARAALTSPWHLLRAVVGLVPAVLVAGTVMALVGGVLWWALSTNRLVIAPRGVPGGTAPGGGNEPWVYSAVLAGAVLLGLVAVWFGPASRLTRMGARRSLAAVAPPGAVAAVLVVLALIGALVLAALVVAGQSVTWWPLSGALAPGRSLG
jgi:hypothetical protein